MCSHTFFPVAFGNDTPLYDKMRADTKMFHDYLLP